MTQQKERRSLKTALEEVSITAIKDQGAEKRKDALEKFMNEINTTIDVTDPSTAFDTILERLTKIAWFVRKEAEPHLAAKDKEKCAVFMQKWERWIEEVASGITEISFTIKRWETTKIVGNQSEEEKKLMQTKAHYSAEGTALETIWFVRTHVFALAHFIWSVAWGREDIIPTTVIGLQLPVGFDGGRGFGGPISTSGGRTSQTHQRPEDKAFPASMSSELED